MNSEQFPGLVSVRPSFNTRACTQVYHGSPGSSKEVTYSLLALVKDRVKGVTAQNLAAHSHAPMSTFPPERPTMSTLDMCT